MMTPFEYRLEMQELVGRFYEPVTTKPDTMDGIVIKTLTEIHKDLINVLPARWVYEDDVQLVLKDLGFQEFNHKEDGNHTFVYYLKPKA